VFQVAEYGVVVSVAIVVHELAPAAERWKAAFRTPEPASAESEVTDTVVPRTFADAAGAVTEPVGLVESFVNVRLVVVAVFPTTSTDDAASLGALVVPSVHAKALVVTNGPPDGVEIVSPACVQPVDVPPSAGKVAEAAPDPPLSLTLFVSWKLPPDPPPVPR
jgi:hypothetical protein